MADNLVPTGLGEQLGMAPSAVYVTCVYPGRVVPSNEPCGAPRLRGLKHLGETGASRSGLSRPQALGVFQPRCKGLALSSVESCWAEGLQG